MEIKAVFIKQIHFGKQIFNEGDLIKVTLKDECCQGYHILPKEHTGILPERCNDREAKGNIGNKHTVHNIDMNHIRACGLNAVNLFKELGKIASKHRRRNFNHKHLVIM